MNLLLIAILIRIATTEYWKDKTTGEKQEKTEWHKVVFFGKLSEICSRFLKKGSKVFIEGSLRTNKWKDSSGVDKYSTEIIGSNIQMLDSKQSINDTENTQAVPKTVESKINFDDDDIPF